MNKNLEKKCQDWNKKRRYELLNYDKKRHFELLNKQGDEFNSKLLTYSTILINHSVLYNYHFTRHSTELQ